MSLTEHGAHSASVAQMWVYLHDGWRCHPLPHGVQIRPKSKVQRVSVACIGPEFIESYGSRQRTDEGPVTSPATSLYSTS